LFINTIKCPKLTKAVEQQAYDEATRMPDKKNGHDNRGIDALGYLIAKKFPLKFTRRKPIQSLDGGIVNRQDFDVFA
jgi:hypothetical protein